MLSRAIWKQSGFMSHEEQMAMVFLVPETQCGRAEASLCSWGQRDLWSPQSSRTGVALGSALKTFLQKSPWGWGRLCPVLGSSKEHPDLPEPSQELAGGRMCLWPCWAPRTWHRIITESTAISRGWMLQSYLSSAPFPWCLFPPLLCSFLSGALENIDFPAWLQLSAASFLQLWVVRIVVWV